MTFGIRLDHVGFPLAVRMDETQKRERFTNYWLSAEPSVSAYVFASVSSFHDAEDLVQRIAQELARRFDEYDSNRPFIGWALWIAKSRVIDFYRTQGRSRLVFSDALLGRLADTIASQSEGRSQRREALELCLETLPSKSRKLLDLRYVEGLSSTQVAQATGSTSGSVRVLLSRVRTALASCIRQRIAMENP
ncbi:MAG: sigma-70 family RNA polymerase sigma factor [Planctomycetota bacterium]